MSMQSIVVLQPSGAATTVVTYVAGREPVSVRRYQPIVREMTDVAAHHGAASRHLNRWLWAALIVAHPDLFLC